MNKNLCTILFCIVFFGLGLLLSFCWFQKYNSNNFKVSSHNYNTDYHKIIKLNSRTGETWILQPGYKWGKITDSQPD